MDVHSPWNGSPTSLEWNETRTSIAPSTSSNTLVVCINHSISYRYHTAGSLRVFCLIGRGRIHASGCPGILAAKFETVFRGSFLCGLYTGVAWGACMQAESMEEALERAERFAEAGADILFIDALESAEEMARFGELRGAGRNVPKMASMLEGGGKTPLLSRAELANMNFKIVAYPLSLLGVSVRAMQRALVVRLSPCGHIYLRAHLCFRTVACCSRCLVALGRRCLACAVPHIETFFNIVVNPDCCQA